MNPPITDLYDKLDSVGVLPRDNPLVHFVEVIPSHDPTLREGPDGSDRMVFSSLPYDPTTILLGAKLAVWEEKSLSPVKPDLLTRSDILSNYQLLYDKSESSEEVTIRQTILLRPPHFSRAPFDSLSPVVLSDMMLHKVHQGKYLICRAIFPAIRLVAIQVAVEDKDGNVADLACYHCFETSGLGRDDIRSLIPVGQVILIKEPWFRIGATGGTPTVRVDTPSDIMFLSPNDPLLQNFPDDWKGEHQMDVLGYKTLGNEAVKQKHLQSAVQAYTAGLEIDPTASLLRLNRAHCHLQLGNVSLALEDAQIASEDPGLPDDTRHKARFRMALAYYAMDRFTDALNILEDEVAARWSPTDFESLRKKARARLVEQTQANYDWLTLRKLGQDYSDKRHVLDVADYVGPVKVIPMNGGGGGRGLVTTRQVMAGELLILAKPFAFASPYEFPERLRALHADRIIDSDKAYYELIGRVARRLAGDRTAASALFLDLFPGGSYQPLGSDETTGTSSMPTFLAHGSHHWTLLEEYAIGDIDINKVIGIVENNSFSQAIRDSTLGECAGVYLLPSMINHACHGTAVRGQLGSVLTMRAVRDLQEGEEVTCSYVGVVDSNYLNRERALKRWIDGCSCELCSADRRDGETRSQKREQYELELMQAQMAIALGNGQMQSVRALQELVTKIRSTYLGERKAPMETLGLAQYTLATAIGRRSPNQSLQLLIDALRSYGIGVKHAPPKRVPTNHSQLRRDNLIIETSRFPSQVNSIGRCVEIMVAICGIQYSQKKYSLASHWAVAALWTHEAFNGPGKKHLLYSFQIEEGSSDLLEVLLEKFN